MTSNKVTNYIGGIKAAKALGAIVLAAAGLFFMSPSIAAERAAAIDGTSNHYAVITPTFTGTSVGPQSFIRLFNGTGSAGTTSTFAVTIVGTPSGSTYGTTKTISIPTLASIQYSIQDLLVLTGAGALANGDTGYSVYIQNSDAEAGYQHVVYDWTTNLFENLSNCGASLNEKLIPLHNEMVLTNLHTSGGPNKIGVSFPSTLQIYNYSSSPITYDVAVYNAGGRTNGSFSANSGKKTCTIGGNTVPGKAALSMPMSRIEANAACLLDSDEDYINVVVSNHSGAAPNAVLTHLIHVAQYNGNSSMSEVCAVNK